MTTCQINYSFSEWFDTVCYNLHTLVFKLTQAFHYRKILTVRVILNGLIFVFLFLNLEDTLTCFRGFSSRNRVMANSLLFNVFTALTGSQFYFYFFYTEQKNGGTRFNVDLYRWKEHPLRVPKKVLLHFCNENFEKVQAIYPNTMHFNKTIRC